MNTIVNTALILIIIMLVFGFYFYEQFQLLNLDNLVTEEIITKVGKQGDQGPPGLDGGIPTTILLNRGVPGTNSSCKSDGCIFDPKYCTELYGQCGILQSDFKTICDKWDKCSGGVCRDDYKFKEKQYCLARGQIDEKSKSDMWGYKKVVL